MWFPQQGFPCNMQQQGMQPTQGYPMMQPGMPPMQGYPMMQQLGAGDVGDEGRAKSKRHAHHRERASRRRAASVSGDSDDSVVAGDAARKRMRAQRSLGAKNSDDDVICSNYRFLGGRLIYGDKIVWPKAQKIKALRRCDEGEFNPLRLASLDDEAIDQLIFLATNCPPSLKLTDLKINTKGELRRLLKREHDRSLMNSPNRSKLLSPDYGNLADVVRSLGYPLKFLEQADPNSPDASRVVAIVPRMAASLAPKKEDEDRSDGASSASIAKLGGGTLCVVPQLMVKEPRRAQPVVAPTQEAGGTESEGDEDFEAVAARERARIEKEVTETVKKEMEAERLKKSKEARKQQREEKLRQLREKLYQEAREKATKEYNQNEGQPEDPTAKATLATADNSGDTHSGVSAALDRAAASSANTAARDASALAGGTDGSEMVVKKELFKEEPGRETEGESGLRQALANAAAEGDRLDKMRREEGPDEATEGEGKGDAEGEDE